MANAVYPFYKGAILTAASTTSLNTDTSNDGPYASLIDTGTYTYNVAHDTYSDITGVVGATDGIRITTPTVVTTASSTGGTFDGDDVIFTSVSGATVEAYIIHRNNAGTHSTGKLVVYYDTSGGGLPVTPNGGNITIQWNASGIFLISDKRAKHNLKRVGWMNNAIPIYEYEYLWSREPQIGVMAQDVPHAMVQMGDLMGVNYARL